MVILLHVSCCTYGSIYLEWKCWDLGYIPVQLYKKMPNYPICATNLFSLRMISFLCSKLFKVWYCQNLIFANIVAI